MLAPRDLHHCPHNEVKSKNSSENGAKAESARDSKNKYENGYKTSTSPTPSGLSAAAVQFSGVSFGYGSSAVLRDLSFTLERGLVVSLLGPSGCGKTSVLRLIAGLERVDAGQIFLDDSEVCSRERSKAPELRAGVGEIGMVFQDFALFPHLTAAENLGLALSGCDERARLKREGYSGDYADASSRNFGDNALDVAKSRKLRIASMLEMVELRDYADKYPQELSGGQQQRVALARALVTSPRLLLLDEPFANLDVRLRDRIRDRTLHLVQSLRCSVLLVTHDAEESMYLADRLLVMDDRGYLLQTGSPRSVYGQPRDAFTASLLSEVNRFSVEVVAGYVSTPFGRYRADFSNAPQTASAVTPTVTPTVTPSVTPWAEVVIRPQSLSLSSEDGNARAGTAVGVVEAARMIGGHSLVHLSSCLPAHAGHGEEHNGGHNGGHGEEHNGEHGDGHGDGHDGEQTSEKAGEKAGEALSIGDDCEHDCKPVHLHARVAGCFLPSRGTRLRISVASSDVFLFEQKSSRSL